MPPNTFSPPFPVLPVSAGRQGPFSRDEITRDTEVGDLGSEEGFAERRLSEADELVRAGIATVGDGCIEIGFLERDGGSVRASVPLPPEAVEPALELVLPESIVPAEGSEALFRDIVDRLGTFLPGSLLLRVEGCAARIRWRPHSQAAPDAVSRVRALGAHLGDAVASLIDGAPQRTVLEAMTDRLFAHRGRAEVLAREFHGHSLLQQPCVGLFHLLVHLPGLNRADDPRLWVMQRSVDLLAPGIGRGLFVAIRLPNLSAEHRDQLARVLADRARIRLGIALAESSDYAVLGGWSHLDETLLLTGVEQLGRDIGDLVEQLRDLLRFIRSYQDLVAKGRHPFDLLGARFEVEQPEPDPSHTSDDARPGPAEPAVEIPDAAPDRAEPAPERPPERQKEGLPPRQKEEPAEGAPVEAPAPSMDQLSAREVVKRLRGLEEASNITVFLAHPGYNPDKTAKIMSLVLSVPLDEARAFCERAPCEVASGIAPSRAKQIKQVLEGTGARIRLVDPERLDEPSEAQDGSSG